MPGDLFLNDVLLFVLRVFLFMELGLWLPFSFSWLIIKWCIVLPLHPCLVSFWVSPSISHFVFPLHGYAMNRGGVLVVARRYPKYSRLT